MKRCRHCQSRAYLADVRCQRCGAAIEPPPPIWLQRVGAALWVLIIVTFPFHAWHFLTETVPGQGVAALLVRAGRYTHAHAGELGGLFLALVVVPLVCVYGGLRAMVDLGDWLDLKVQQWRAERFRRFGW